MRSAFLLAATLLPVPAFAAPATLLVQSEEFQFPGDWNEDQDPQALGGKAMKTLGADMDALTAVTVPQAGHYYVWTRAKDFPTDPGTRLFKISVDGQILPNEAGRHGDNGWKWEKAGEVDLTAGDHVLGLHDTAHFFGRSDAVLLMTENVDPNTFSRTELMAKRVAPKTVDAERVTQFAPEPAIQPGTRQQVASIENSSVRIRFFQVTGTDGKPQIQRETELQVNGAWQPLAVRAGEERLFLQFTPKTTANLATYLPSWKTEPSAAPVSRFTVGGKAYETRESNSNPFFAAPATALIARSVKVVGRAAEVQYAAENGFTATGRWELALNARDAKFTLSYTAVQPGFYSFGFSPFQSFARNQIQFNLLSPLFQYNRLPKNPVMVTSSETPHPLALAQVDQGGQPVSLAVAADPDRLPFRWANTTNPVYGFSLLNQDGLVQPSSFSPVLGLDGSEKKAGETGSIVWRVLAYPGDWKSALEYASNSIYGVTDYRKPYGTTLTGAALNIVDLMKNADAAGWDPRLKGFYNIEAAGVASQAAPLAVVEAAVLSRDEELYRTRALPTIEYTLSRPGAHFAVKLPANNLGYVNEETIKMKVPSDFFGASYWQGLDALLGHANPWIAQLAYKDGEPRFRASYSSMPHWSELMAAYRLKAEPALLAKVQAEADEFLAKEIYGKPTKDLGVVPFYNISYYPYWWDLLDLYEVTHDKKYLDAAEQGGFLTMAGMWSQPRIPAGDVTIHPGGQFQGQDHLWWKNEAEFRLGFPRRAGDSPEKKVPAWVVSQVGLGLEQPSTYYGGGSGGFQNIQMSAWAANLLRLYRYTGREMYQTYARNTILSRWANYPGYYMRGYSDLQMQPDYPYKGPDVTSIYYHHIPPHLAFTIDYVVTEAEQRSNGQIDFPWSKQQGYVWFANRIYGQAPGTVFGDRTARLWLDRNAAKTDSNAINLLLARGQDRVWLILSNEADTAVTAPIALNKTALGYTGAAATVYGTDGKTTPLAVTPTIQVPVPAKGLVAVSLPAVAEAPMVIPPLEGGRASQKLTGDWGTLEVFRIRGPFGKDSLYALLTGRPADGATATLNLEGAAPQEKKEYPYEFTVYPWAMNQDLKFTVSLKDKAGNVTTSQPVVLAGTKVDNP